MSEELVDADQMEFEDEIKKEDKPDPTGVGMALRMHWQMTVREETEKQIKEVGESYGLHMPLVSRYVIVTLSTDPREVGAGPED